jgi:signal transduction histidine kinase
MRTVVHRLVPLLAHAARRQGVTLETGVPDGLPDVAVDPARVQQVLLNVLMNAVEATPRGGQVQVEARASVHDGRPGVSLEISDTGSGIAPEALSRIFDPFFTTKAPGQGTGLGLAITRDIVRDHGGTIAVQSRVGQGTTFTIWLPAWEAAA